MKHFGSLILLFLLSSSVFAGFHSFTMHSRASCGNNETIRGLAEKIEEEKSKGYREQDNIHVRELIAIKKLAQTEIASFKNDKNPLDTHIKPTLSDLQLGFKFKNPIRNEIIGYVPAGGYYKANSTFNKTSHDGWSGIKIFFNESKIGVCSFTYYDLNLSHGAVKLNQDIITYAVNNKPTYSMVEGSYNSGFMYSVSWFSKMTMNNLECANMIFDKKIKDDTIALANKIDSNIG